MQAAPRWAQWAQPQEDLPRARRSPWGVGHWQALTPGVQQQTPLRSSLCRFPTNPRLRAWGQPLAPKSIVRDCSQWDLGVASGPKPSLHGRADSCLTEDSGVLCFLSLEAATGLWVTVPNSIVSPWCQFPERCKTHIWDNRGNSLGTGWPGVTVSPRKCFPV